ncbi:glycosyltransferase family 2 protein [Actinomadura latina]|nr:glycosyltransferase family A protein [Actinomadura latina]
MTVIVIAYNDARRLARAVRSALEQSLARVEVVIVDDASIDATPKAAARLEAANPDRVRSIRLPVNSGGCGDPRDAGLQLARGRYVMFLRSATDPGGRRCRTVTSAACRSSRSSFALRSETKRAGTPGRFVRPWRAAGQERDDGPHHRTARPARPQRHRRKAHIR